MENVTTTVLSYKKNLLITLGAVLCLTAIIVLAMPNTEKPRLPYSINEPWMNPQLISPGNFYVNKDPLVYEKEKEEAIAADYLPYYNLDINIGNRMSEKFLDTHKEGMPGVSAYAVQVVAEELRKRYETGIISTPDYNRLISEDSTYTFMLARENTAERVILKEIYSTKQAYESLLNDPRLVTVKEMLQQTNLNEYVTPNVTYNELRSEQARQGIIAGIAATNGEIKMGQEIINRGDIVTEEKARVIESYNDFVASKVHNDTYSLLRTNGVQALYVFIMMALALLYMHFFRKDYFTKPRSLALMLSLLTIFPVLNSVLIRFDPLNAMILPICLVPIFIRIFLDSRTAFMAHIVLVLLCSATVAEKFEFIAIQMAAGYTAICALREPTRRSQTFYTALIVTLTYIVVYTVVKFLDNNDVSFDTLERYYVLFIFNGIFLLLAYPLMLLVEKSCKFISPITLIELSDTNSGLLRRLSEVAPGTFQHSFMVSNLAGAIASEIGAKSLLVRVGALYHDIGKLTNPVFFTENQHGVNPHTRLTPQESARIIISHVQEGVQLAEKNGVPDVIRNFIITHHGESITRYFYNTYKNEHPNEDVDIKPFKYAGPNPFSKETAILMMADSVEAASRSLSEYNEETITNLVNGIVDKQVAEGFFRNCQLTFRDVDTAKRVLIDKLIAIHHPRIKYPELKTTNA